jgi:hypothetical protein
MQTISDLEELGDIMEEMVTTQEEVQVRICFPLILITST